MSLLFSYDFEKHMMITLSIVAISLTIGLVLLSLNQVYGQSDFTLEGKVNSNDPLLRDTYNLTITKFEIQGESYKQMCPSLQCKIVDYDYLLMSPPDPVIPAIGYNTGFNLEDNSNVTNSDIGPKEKEFLKLFSILMNYCRVHDIIEDNGQEIYYCNGLNTILRNFDSKIWSYDSTGVYDAKNQTLKVNGNFTG